MALDRGHDRLGAGLRGERLGQEEPVHIELDRVGAYLAGEIVLVTGAGGSIGAELCRQISRVGPKRLVLVDHAEDNLFEILRELEEDRHVRNAVAVLADCKEEERMREVFTEHRPSIVFHAAAYKHVALMEHNPIEAVQQWRDGKLRPLCVFDSKVMNYTDTIATLTTQYYVVQATRNNWTSPNSNQSGVQSIALGVCNSV